MVHGRERGANDAGASTFAASAATIGGVHGVTASGALAVIREALLDAWAVLQPVECLGCGAPDRAVCAACREALAAPAPEPVATAADIGVPVWAGADYRGPFRGAVIASKEHARLDAAARLAPALRAAVARALRECTGPVELAPIPSTRRAIRRRGHDPVAELLDAARLPTSRVLVALPASAGQKTRDRAARLASAGRFRCRPVDGRRFLVVDDVVTTGATLADAVRAIRDAGGEVIAAACCCRTALTRTAGADGPSP